MYSLIAFVIASASLSSATLFPRTGNVTLAVRPNCGSFGGSPRDVKAGLPSLTSFSTIVAFGDSYTDGGKHDGSSLNPPIIHQPNPLAGGRHSNGPVWIEYLAEAAGANLEDYAAAGAVVDAKRWPATNGSSDFITQANIFLGRPVPRPAPESTLYVIFFGIGDYVQSSSNGDASLSVTAQGILGTLLRLSSSPMYAKNILVVDNHGRGTETAAGTEFKEELFRDLSSFSSGIPLNIAFVDFSTIWNGVLGTTPGFEAFGYTSTEACLASPTSTAGSCHDPDHAFYWFPGTPSTATHRIMSDYVRAVWDLC